MANFKRTLSVIILVALFLLSLFSCGGGKGKKDDRTVFRYNEIAGISSLDPAAARNDENIRPVNQLFNGLVQMNDLLQVEPAIAKSWTVSEDGKTYTFILRSDVFFHD
ncbi:MAG: ABC transporter substrate-binding protein, partial [Bacteroidia bacterium]